jgi:hypothetical protein
MKEARNLFNELEELFGKEVEYIYRNKYPWEYPYWYTTCTDTTIGDNFVTDEITSSTYRIKC